MPKPSAKKPARRRAKAVAEPTGSGAKLTVVCQAPDCDVEFTPKRSTARFHTATCQKRAARARRAAEAAAAIDKAAADAPAEHGLVRATRLELEKHEVLDTVDGQIAMQLARKLTDPDHVSPGLAKELRATIIAAKGGVAPPPTEGDGAGGSEPEDDEVTRARKAREEARQAAGHA